VLREGRGGDSGAALFRTRALGTTVELLLTEPSRIVAAAELLREELERIDRVASRFRNDSEVSRLNGSCGREVPVSDDLMEALQVALWAAEVTGGAVDPTVGGALSRLGYDRDFALVADGVDGALPRPAPVPGWRRVQISTDRHEVSLPPGTELDLGATAKALAADRAAAAICEQLECGVLVSMGGDIAASGPPPPNGFVVGLADVCDGAGQEGGSVAISGGGLATSGVAKRHWRLGGRTVHHIVDPATGLPAPTCWRTVTVAAGSCVEANAASTACLVKAGSALDWLRSLGLPARLVGLGGEVTTVGPWGDEG
jgi:thiamine biosynthesis lipoprotein